MVKIKQLSEVEFSDTDYYRTKNIPATGCYIREEDKFTQFKLE
jgi:DNA gyrase subunit A